MKTLTNFSNEIHDEIIKFVSENGMNLEYAPLQTPEICIAAVMQNKNALIFVTDKYESLCLEAVRKNGLLLEHINVQTPKIRLATLKQNGLSVSFVKTATDEYFLESLLQNEKVIENIGHRSFDLLFAYFMANSQQVSSYLLSHFFETNLRFKESKESKEDYAEHCFEKNFKSQAKDPISHESLFPMDLKAKMSNSRVIMMTPCCHQLFSKESMKYISHANKCSLCMSSKWRNPNSILFKKGNTMYNLEERIENFRRNVKKVKIHNNPKNLMFEFNC